MLARNFKDFSRGNNIFANRVWVWDVGIWVELGGCLEVSGGGFPIILKNQADFSGCFPRFRSKVYRMNCRGKFDRCQNQMKPRGLVGCFFFVGVLVFFGRFSLDLYTDPNAWKCLELLKITFSSSVVITVCSENVLYFFPYALL